MTATDGCTCGRIAVGMEVTEVRNWNPECGEHGRDSAWWNSPEQQAKREAQRAELIELQARAREARNASRLVPCGSTPENPRCTVSKHAVCEKHG